MLIVIELLTKTCLNHFTNFERKKERKVPKVPQPSPGKAKSYPDRKISRAKNKSGQIPKYPAFISFPSILPSFQILTRYIIDTPRMLPLHPPLMSPPRFSKPSLSLSTLISFSPTLYIILHTT